VKISLSIDTDSPEDEALIEYLLLNISDEGVEKVRRYFLGRGYEDTGEDNLDTGSESKETSS
jgi:hypothetical protein